MVGEQIGGYRIEEKLGEGGMGTVYRAFETGLGRNVAIKVLNADLARNPSIAERFRAEARAQAQLIHTNVAVLYTLLEHNGSAMMVMEYVEGETFQQMATRRAPVPHNEIIPLFRQALDGIGAAHKMGIVHRDIKPANLMLNKLGVVKVMDFGIAKLVGDDHSLTRTGVQVGTAYYMSPEQIKSEPVDARADIYALGVTLYEMLTAHMPFAANSEFQVLTNHVNTPPPLLTGLCADIPKGVENIVLKALEKRPQDRFQTCEEFAAALAHPDRWERFAPKYTTSMQSSDAPTAEISVAAFKTPPPCPPATPTTPPVPVQKKSRKGWVIAACVVVLMAGYNLTSRSKSRKKLASAPAVVETATPPPAVAPPKPSPFDKKKEEKATTPPSEKADAPETPPVTPAAAGAPPSVVPVGTGLTVALGSAIMGDEAAQGQVVAGAVDLPVIVDGRSVIATGSPARMRIAKLLKSSRSNAVMHLTLDSVTVDGRAYAVQTELVPVVVSGKGRWAGRLGPLGKWMSKTKSTEAPGTLLPEGAKLEFTLAAPVKLGQ